MVALADYREAADELIGVYLAAEPPLHDHGAVVADAAEPRRGGGGGGMRLEQEIVGGGADFLEIVDVGLVGEDRLAEAGEGGAGGGGGGAVSVEAGGGGGAGDDEIVGAGGGGRV